MKHAAKQLLRRLGLLPAEVSPAGHFPEYRALDVRPVYRDDATRGLFTFVLPVVPKGSGGIADIVNLGEALRARGEFDVTYLLDARQDPATGRRNLLWTHPGIDERRIWTSCPAVPEFLCMTTWPTVYSGASIPSRKKLFFMQDHEAAFHGAGVGKFYADHVMHLGIPILTLGPWLQHLLRERGCSAPVEHIPFPFCDAVAPESDEPRNAVAVYLQPDKMHRGTELLIETLRLAAPRMAREFPGVSLVIFGSRINPHIAFDFPCDVHGVLDAEALRGLLRRTRLGVSASFTNISLMPFRYLAAGAPCVELDLPNVTHNIPDEARSAIRVAPPSAERLADAILDTLRNAPDGAALRTLAARLHATHGWDACADVAARFVRSL